eukprot:GEMP01018707.1.p1 GENE.GEMP01018707.1~~GEMP01018707.1.p1  ORF type:complete len:367 (+),score=95.62 GEMP01018707.1:134-1234(+)
MDPSSVLGQLLKPGEDPQVLNERLQELQGFFQTVLYPETAGDAPTAAPCAPVPPPAPRAQSVVPAQSVSMFVEKPLAGTCPRGHDLAFTRIPYVGRCDGCIKRLEVTTDITRCEVCEYDLCLSCKLNGIKLPASSFIPVGATPFTPSSLSEDKADGIPDGRTGERLPIVPLFHASASTPQATAKRLAAEQTSLSKKIRPDIPEASAPASSITSPEKEQASSASASASSTAGPSGHSLSSPTTASRTTGASLQKHRALDKARNEHLQNVAQQRVCAQMEPKTEISEELEHKEEEKRTTEFPDNQAKKEDSCEKQPDAAVKQPTSQPRRKVRITKVGARAASKKDGKTVTSPKKFVQAMKQVAANDGN